MPDPTDAFCERCGTRYTFLPSAPGTISRRRVRVLARGLKDYILTDHRSLDTALTLARQDDARQDYARAAEAFRGTFNFCFSCRLTVCPNCWNVREGACAVCAPEPAQPDWPADELVGATPAARGETRLPAVPAPPPSAPPQSGAPPASPEPRPQTVVVRTQTLRPGLAGLLRHLGSRHVGGPQPAAPRWPRPTPWQERPIVVQAWKEGEDTDPRPVPVVAEASPPSAVSAAPELGSAPACHNCGLPIESAARFCRRCGLQVGRWTNRGQLAAKPE
jgi:hypothetical protein